MEALFLLLVAALLFTQAWYLLGLYADPRAVGVISLALALGLLGAAAVAGTSSPLLINPNTTVVVSAMHGFILLWAVYATALGAHALWGFEERALGFHALILAVISLGMVGLPQFFTEAEVSTDAALVIQASAFILAVLSALVFFLLAVPFRQLRSVTGWFLLVGSIPIVLLGLAVFFGVFATVAAA